jgi:hypothetical protein
MKTKSVSPRRVSLAMISSLLVVIAVLTTVLLNAPVKVAQAAVPSGGIVNGIDYSGQGTVTANEIRNAEATVDGNYVRVPTVTYGAYTYSTWDEFWAGWSSWSPNNKSYYDQKGYDYNGQHKIVVTDAERKTEYRYYRWNSVLNPQYITRYYTEYKTVTKILFFSITTYSTSSSLGSYLGDVSGKTINRQWTESEFSHNAGGYEYTGWQDSAPSARTGWPLYENAWSTYESRYTYRYKSCNLSWDASFKVKSSELVPLKYALNPTAGTSNKNGIKWVWNDEISSTKKRSGNYILYVENRDITEYYLTAGQAQTLFRNQSLLAKDVSTADLIRIFGELGIGIFTLPANWLTGLALVFLTASDALRVYCVQKGISTVDGIMVAATELNITMRISLIVDEIVYPLAGGTRESQSGVSVTPYTASWVSMRHSQNQTNGGDSGIYGTVSYIKETDIQNIISGINKIFQLKYNFQLSYTGG